MNLLKFVLLLIIIIIILLVNIIVTCGAPKLFILKRKDVTHMRLYTSNLNLLIITINVMLCVIQRKY